MRGIDAPADGEAFDDDTPCPKCGGFGWIATRDPNVAYLCECTKRKRARRAKKFRDWADRQRGNMRKLFGVITTAEVKR